MKRLVTSFTISSIFLISTYCSHVTIFERAIKERFEQFNQQKDINALRAFARLEGPKPLAITLRVREILSVGLYLIFLNTTYTTQEKLDLIGDIISAWDTYGDQILEQDYLRDQEVFENQGISLEDFKKDKDADISTLLQDTQKLLSLAKQDGFEQFSIGNPMEQKTGNLPIHTAYKNGFVHLTDYLFKLGARPWAQNMLGQTIIHLAAGDNRVDVLNDIKYRYPDITFDLYDKFGNTPLHWAVNFGAFDAAEFILSAEPDVIKVKNNSGYTPLHIAIIQRNQQIANLLLQMPHSNVNVQDNEGDTPLHKAVKNADTQLILILLNKQADPTIQNNAGQTPAGLARALGHNNIANIVDAKAGLRRHST